MSPTRQPAQRWLLPPRFLWHGHNSEATSAPARLYWSYISVWNVLPILVACSYVYATPSSTAWSTPSLPAWSFETAAPGVHLFSCWFIYIAVHLAVIGCAADSMPKLLVCSNVLTALSSLTITISRFVRAVDDTPQEAISYISPAGQTLVGAVAAGYFITGSVAPWHVVSRLQAASLPRGLLQPG